MGCRPIDVTRLFFRGLCWLLHWTRKLTLWTTTALAIVLVIVALM